MNKMKRHLHRVLALLLGCVLLCCPVFAAEDCSLWVSILDEERQGVNRFNVELIPVTTFDGSAHTLTAEFEGMGLSAEEVSTLGAEQAEKAYQYLQAEGFHGWVVSTNSQGVADFGVLDQGIYLVFDRGNQLYTFPPYLVSLPTQTITGTLYHVHSEPKAVTADSRTILVAVEWIDDDNAAGKRPESVEVTLLRDTSMRLRAAQPTAGALPFRSVVVNPACRWQHMFHSLPTFGEYSVEGSAVPEYTLVEIEPVMEGFVLIYEYTPSPNPPSPPSPPGPGPGPWPNIPTPPAGGEQLPQTGFRLLPVYALLGVGSLLVVLGLVDLCVKKEET